MPQGKEKLQKKDRENRHLKLQPMITSFLLIGLILAGTFILIRPTPEKPFDKFIDRIRSQGFTPNIGMSNLFQPGTVIRTKATAPDGTERDLDPPLFFAWPEECFPELAPKASPYLMPETEASDMSSFTLGMETIGRLLPTLSAKSTAVSDYTIRLQNCRLISIAEPEIARRFSRTCVENIKNAMRDGKKLEWFSVIMQVIAAESFTFEIQWHDTSTAESRLNVQERVQTALATIDGNKGSGPPGPLPIKADIQLTSAERRKTVFSGTGNLVIGYKAHILEAVYKDN